MNRHGIIGAASIAAAAIVASGCSSHPARTVPAPNPTVSAELHQGALLVQSCFPGTLVQQASTVHLVFLSSATGKHGPEVVAARQKVLTCLHISDKSKQQAFINKAGGDAVHGHLATHAGRVTYFQVTLPRDVLAAGGTAAGPGTSTAQPSIPGVSASS